MAAESYKAVLIADLDFEMQLKVLTMRNQKGVRKWMYSDHLIDASEHIKWIEHLKTNDRQKVFIIIKNKTDPIGLTSVNNIDVAHKKASWAFYLDEAYQGGGLGAVIEFNVLDYCFDILKLDKLNCEVLEGNAATLKLHEKFLFQKEGFIRSNIVKNGVRIGVHLLGITREEWIAGRFAIKSRYGFLFSKRNIVF
jgi:UDP-4-amino-4,6-dideoxy-N-acetyl-beta-L-altrosamine N-acetyltransferase